MKEWIVKRVRADGHLKERFSPFRRAPRLPHPHIHTPAHPRTHAPAILVAALTAVALAGCSRKPDAPTSREYRWPAMGTYASLVVNGEGADAAMAIARDAVEEVNAALSAFNPTSDVSRVNAKAGDGDFTPTRIHFQTMMAASRRCHEASGGAFNPAVGPLMEAWGFFRGGSAHVFPPAAAAIDEARRLCDFTQADMREDGAARLNLPGMRLDFGAIAKGYGVDVAFERLIAAGCSNIIVNLGGNMRCAGERPGGGPWRIAVRDPRGGLDTATPGMLWLDGGMAVATSGNYEQYFELDGRRYTHIMDPRTGRPVSGMAQVTVVARTATEADALSTACFVLGAEAGSALLTQYPGSGAMFVTIDESGALSTTMTGDFAKYYREER